MLPAPLPPRPITARQGQALALIIAHKAAHDGCSPSIRQLQALLDLHTTSAVYSLLQSLSAAGRITVESGEARSIQVTGAIWTPPAG